VPAEVEFTLSGVGGGGPGGEKAGGEQDAVAVVADPSEGDTSARIVAATGEVVEL
jgi:hypothetical protein